jgi:DNA polymerase III epsilon subunit-like protein
MINKNYYCVIDLETIGANPYECDVIQIGAVIVDPRKLEIVPGSEFNCRVKPEQYAAGSEEYRRAHASDIQFHMGVFKETEDEFCKRLDIGVPLKEAWTSLVNYTKNWYVPGGPKSTRSAPIMVGYNIYNFDKVILDRIATQFKNVDKQGRQNVFNQLFSIDLIHTVFMWNESLHLFENYKLDTLRKYLDINSEGIAHEALKDCYDEATLLIKYLNLHRYFCKKVKGWQ